MVRSILLASVVALCYGLVPSRPTVSRTVSLKMSESSTALVPVNDENIKASAAVTAGGAGLVLGGPVLAVVTSVLGNYGSRQESEVPSRRRISGKSGGGRGIRGSAGLTVADERRAARAAGRGAAAPWGGVGARGRRTGAAPRHL